MGPQDFECAEANRLDGAAAYVPGPKVRVDRDVVRGLLEKNADFYLHELQAKLKTTAGIQVSVPHLCKIVGELGFKLKKSHSTRPNGTRK